MISDGKTIRPTDLLNVHKTNDNPIIKIDESNENFECITQKVLFDEEIIDLIIKYHKYQQLMTKNDEQMRVMLLNKVMSMISYKQF